MTGIVQEVLRVPPVGNGTSYGGRLTGPTASGIARQIVNLPFGTLPEVKVVANGIAVVERPGDVQPGNGEPQPRDSTVYIADTARGAIWAVRLDEQRHLSAGQTGCDATLQDDTLCEHTLLVAHPWLEGADGIWADDHQGLWVAANARQGIVHVDLRQQSVTEYFRNPVNAQLLRSSADTVEGSTHILEYPSSPVIVPNVGRFRAGTLCVTSIDRPARDNWPGTVGEIGGPGQDKGKISCF